MLVVRWASGIGALLLVSFVLQSHGFKLYLLPWLPFGIIIHAVYGFMISRKHTKVISILFVVAESIRILVRYLYGYQ